MLSWVYDSFFCSVPNQTTKIRPIQATKAAPINIQYKTVQLRRMLGNPPSSCIRRSRRSKTNIN
jgi:hypothetical protein